MITSLFWSFLITILIELHNQTKNSGSKTLTQSKPIFTKDLFRLIILVVNGHVTFGGHCGSYNKSYLIHFKILASRYLISFTKFSRSDAVPVTLICDFETGGM